MLPWPCSCHSWSRSHGLVKITKSIFSSVSFVRRGWEGRARRGDPVNGMRSDDFVVRKLYWVAGSLCRLKGYNFVAITGGGGGGEGRREEASEMNGSE